MESVRDVAALVGRILLALIFVLSGLNKIMHVSTTAGYMVHAGIPTLLVYPGLYLSIVVELGCGLLVMAGLQARWAALIIFLWFIPVTFIFHVAGYNQAVRQQQAMAAQHQATAAKTQAMAAHTQQTMYMKNFSIMGGLLLLAAIGPGGFSIDGRRSETGMGAARHAA